MRTDTVPQQMVDKALLSGGFERWTRMILGGRMHHTLSGRSEGRLAQSAPRNCRFKAHNLAVRPLLICAVALLLGATAGHTQWLETKITLPDSLGGAILPTCLTTDTSERYVYIGDGSGAVYVVDAEARTRVAKVPSGFVYSICTNTRRNKVYAADCVGNRVLAISCATNQVVAAIPTGANPSALCYNSTDDKVYVANYDGGDVTVIDCSSDSVTKTIDLGRNPASLSYNPASNKVFCAGYDTLMVIDGSTDSVAAAFAREWYGPIVVNVVANKVYANAKGVGTLVLDGTTGVVLDSLGVGGSWMCLNSRTQKLYNYSENIQWLTVFDCTADTIVAGHLFNDVEGAYSIACDTAADRVYATLAWRTYDILMVIDGVADTVVAWNLGPRQGELIVSSKRGRLYSTDLLGLGLVVYDTGTDSVLRTIMIGGGATMMCYDSLDDKAYYVSYSSLLGEVGAIDAATNRPVGHTQVGPYPQDVIWHAPTNRVYCSGGNLTVVDPTADTVTKVLPLNSGLMCSAPRLNKVYVESPSHINVIDCRTDSMIKTISVPIEPMWSMCYVAHDKLYVGGYGGVAIIDCVEDTIIRTYPFSTSRLAIGRDGERVYCWRPNSLSTFDTAGDTLIGDVPWEAGSAQDLLYAPGVNKVYCTDPGGGPRSGQGCVFVADGTTDSLITQIPVRVPWALGYDSVSGLVYCSSAVDTAVTFMDSRTDSVVGSLNTSVYAATFETVEAHSRVYVGGAGSSLPVIRTDPPGVEEVLRTLAPQKSVVPTIVLKTSPLVVHQPSVLLDATGRKVLDLQPGQHGLTYCRAGVYFLRDRPDGKAVKILLVD